MSLPALVEASEKGDKTGGLERILGTGYRLMVPSGLPHAPAASLTSARIPGSPSIDTFRNSILQHFGFLLMTWALVSDCRVVWSPEQWFVLPRAPEPALDLYSFTPAFSYPLQSLQVSRTPGTPNQHLGRPSFRFVDCHLSQPTAPAS